MIYNISDTSVNFTYISLYLKNFYQSSLAISNTYSLELAKCIYQYLNDIFPSKSITNHANTIINTDSIAEYYLFGKSINTGCKIFPVANNEDTNNLPQFTIYDRTEQIKPSSVNDINGYNISSWPIDETVMQYLFPDTVISENSDIDQIAQAQLLAKPMEYAPAKLGAFDNEFYLILYGIQRFLQNTDPKVIATGYYDIFAEAYLRKLNEVNI